MFQFDKDFVATHTGAAGSFFFKFFWRFFLINMMISVLPLYGLAVISSQNSNELPYTLMTVVTSVTGFIATTVSFWMIRNGRHRDKKSGATTQLVLNNYDDANDAKITVWIRIAFGYYWRCILLVITLNLIGFFVFGTVGTHAQIISFIAFYLGWWWFFLLSDKKSTLISFSAINDGSE